MLHRGLCSERPAHAMSAAGALDFVANLLFLLGLGVAAVAVSLLALP
ncbi:hypothetical protein GCM10027271_05850 [Saccharopolyspora gloriosae]|uniref:Uncharacterized protein n=1 Tax=Saccharopolyspora gloriosae TaxID=455344 RepID=A0A840NQ13_9PSEU|nr:hypothetical protein [Saccharopolyspora gloriosae]MBB5072133.1 hypothetical protein [Saccharopolyspora gloriosae]